ncbi:MAG: hypothetical protein JNN09_01830 [Alphaproteobacteria bacterium]|nr:hypothetical protein [Alphaproteobacteria bacterium]
MIPFVMRQFSPFSISALAVLALLSTPSLGQAEEKPAQPHSRILPVKIHPVQEGADNISKAAPEIQGSKTEAANLDPETLGLLTSQAEGSLGPDLWKGQSRKTIVSSLQAIKEPINAPMHDLLVRALLTTASPPAKVDDKDDIDLFALRLQKLVSLGEFTKAVELYKKHDDQTPLSPAAIESGIEALIGSGKMGLACLESKAAPVRAESPPSAFFADVDFFCKTLLSPVSGSDDELRLANATRVFQENYKLPNPTSFDELNKMGTLQVLSLFKTGSLSIFLQSAPNFQGLSGRNISLLLNQNPESVDIRIGLSVEAAHRGLLSIEDLGKAYSEAFGQISPSGVTSSKIAPNTSKWDNFLSLYMKVASAGSAASVPDLTSLLRLAEPFGGGKALLPLAPLYGSLPVVPANLSDQEAYVMLEIILLAGEALPEALAKRIVQDDSVSNEQSVHSGEMILLSGSQKSSSNKKEEKTSVDKKVSSEENSPSLNKENGQETSLSKALKIVFDETKVQEGFRQEIYDNIFRLTAPDNYVMHSTELIKILRKATKERHAGEVILVGLQILSEQPLESIHPAVLYLVLSSFKAVGLSEETVSLARLALVEPSGKTKEK